MVDTVKILGALLGGGGMSSGSGTSVLKSILDAATKGGATAQAGGGGGLGDLLGSVLGGAKGGGSAQQSGAGGLGDLLGSVLGGKQTQSGAGKGAGLEDLLGGVLGGGLSGGSGSSRGSAGGNDLGGLIEAALKQFGNKETAAQKNTQPKSFEEHSPGMVHSEACEQATLVIRAMVNAAKSDGRVDKQEQDKILGKLGHVTQEEISFVRDEIAKPLDVQGFARDVPPSMANQIYAMSLTAIDLDSNPEAQYLHQLAQGLNISPQTANQIHKQLGAPALYS